MFTKKVALWIILCVLLTACVPLTPPPLSTPTATVFPTPTAESETTPEAITLTIFYTNDEHGWMAGVQPDQSAAHLLGLWRAIEAELGSDHFLILSGGDNWTGPAISTWFAGEGMVAVMNAMGYDVSVIGNHEFDFGLDLMQQRIAEADFPFLSANMRYKADGSSPTDLGIQPYTILDLGDLQVGVIGLTTTSTPLTTKPVNVADFDFIDYEAALRQVVPAVIDAGADIVLVPSHVCMGELAELANQVADLDIDLFGGGHCNELVAREVGGAVLIEGGSYMQSFATATFAVDTATGETTALQHDVRYNLNGAADADVAAIIARWQAATDAELNSVIGYLEKPMAQRSPAMQTLITKAWLAEYPTADISMTNLGGMRAGIEAGDLTLADIINVMPFDNVLVEVQMTGAQTVQALTSGNRPATIGGIHPAGGEWVWDATGEPVDMTATYSVLVNDFLYGGGDGFTRLAEYDPNGYNTGSNWRQPVIDWIEAQNSSAALPLDAAIAQLNSK
ncbi:MAG: bifunctional UDP-sugar hydrolase/5'-nucleotidase [Caldilineaceae bacterium]